MGVTLSVIKRDTRVLIYTREGGRVYTTDFNENKKMLRKSPWRFSGG
jgi:ribosomal protein S17E